MTASTASRPMNKLLAIALVLLLSTSGFSAVVVREIVPVVVPAALPIAAPIAPPPVQFAPDPKEPISRFVYYSQLDPRWASIVLTCENGDTSLFKKRGCGETTFAMLMSTYIDSSWTPARVVDEIYGYDKCRGTGLVQNVELLREQGFTVLQKSISTITLKDYVREGWLVWVHAEWASYGHELLIIGMDVSGNFMVADPYFGMGTLGTDQYPFDETNIIEFYLIQPKEK